MSEKESVSGISTAPMNNKESPLTDIATSPPSFDFLSQDKYNNVEGRSSDEKTLNGDVKNGDTAQQSKDSYESSELSDVGDDQSEAETDKMDFLEDDGTRSGENESDLQTLANLTKLARMKDVDSDYEEADKNSSDGNTAVKQENGEQEEEVNQLVHSGDDSIEDGSVNADSKEISDTEAGNKGKRKIKDDNHGRSKKQRTQKDNQEEQDEEDGEDEEPNESGDEETTRKVKHESGKAEKNEEDHSDSAEIEADGDEDDEDREEEEAEEAEGEDGNIAHQDEQEIKEDLSQDDIDLNEQRKLAVEELISIESSFAELRDKLYQDKLTLLEHELQLCLVGSHPELSKIYYKISDYYQESVQLANSSLNYKLKCINNETLATRTSIHQNFLKQLMDCKSELITNATTLWYKINKERNEMDQVAPNFAYSALPNVPKYVVLPHEEENGYSNDSKINETQDLVPLSKKDIKQNTLHELVQQRNNLNHQLGILNSLSQFYGFPSSIDTSVDSEESPSYELLLNKATEEEILEDCKEMGIKI